MRKQLVIALAYDLKNFSNREVAYEWFCKTVEEYKLDSQEQFSLVFIGSGMNHRPETPEPAKVALEKIPAAVPWEMPKSFNDGKVAADQKPFSKMPAPYSPRSPKAQGPSVGPSAKCLKDARKALGAAPYNEPGNFLVGDGYFSQDCINKYGQRQWDEACRLVLKEMKRF